MARQGWLASLLGALVLSATPFGSAQAADGEDEIDAVLGKEIKDTEAALDGRESGAREPLPEIGEDKLQEFQLSRGFYFSSDLGVFETFGGVKGTSNLQPFMSVNAGYDLNAMFSLQAGVAFGYNSGNPASVNDNPDQIQGAQAVNYSMTNIGGALVAAFRPSERFAVEPKVGGGITRISPEITDPANIDARIGSAPHVMAGVDFKYLTLLTDFSAGFTVTMYYVLGPNVLGVAEAFVVRYTF